MTLAIPAPEPKEIDPDRHTLLIQARDAVDRWTKEVVRLTALIQAELGEAPVGLVNGKEVITYDWKDSWRGADLRRDYPELTQHYMKAKETFDAKDFARHHPDIAKQYQTRAFVVK